MTSKERRHRNEINMEAMKVKKIKPRKILLLLALLFGAVCSGQAQGAKAGYTADRTQHNFGTVVMGKTYKTTFTVTSTGTTPLVLIDARVNCQCTKVAFDKKPLRKGEKAVVTVTYDADKEGVFDKTITLVTNAPKPETILTLRIRGEVKKEVKK